MKPREIKALLRATPAADAPGVDEAVRRCRAVYARRRKLRRLGAAEIIVGQLRFVALPVWLVQGALLVVICLALGRAGGGRHALAMSALTAVLVALTILPFYGRSERHGMREIEAATRVSRVKLLLAKLAAVGVGDAVCLGAAALLTLRNAPGTALVFVVLPFALASAGSLFALNHLPGGAFAATGFAMALVSVYWAMAERLSRLPAAAALAACALAAGVLAAECIKMARDAQFGKDMEEILWT